MGKAAKTTVPRKQADFSTAGCYPSGTAHNCSLCCLFPQLFDQYHHHISVVHLQHFELQPFCFVLGLSLTNPWTGYTTTEQGWGRIKQIYKYTFTDSITSISVIGYYHNWCSVSFNKEKLNFHSPVLVLLSKWFTFSDEWTSFYDANTSSDIIYQ